jgi:RNA polymerase sigma-70 factor, ECF subfamily
VTEYTESNEHAIVEMIRSGIPNSDLFIELLYAEYQNRIFAFICKMVKNPTDAEDLTSDTLLRAINKVKNLKFPAAFKKWLFRIAYSVSVDHLRKQKSDHLDDELCVPGHEEQIVLRVTLESALKALNPHRLESLLLCDIDMKTVREAAKLTKRTDSSIKSSLHKGRTELRHRLAQAVA